MQIIKRSKASINKELICWCGLILYLICYNHVKGSPFAYYTYVVIYTLNFAWAYYLLLLIVFPNFLGKRRLNFVFSFIAVSIIYISIDYFHLKKILPLLGGSNFRADFDLYNYIKHALIPFTFVACSSLGSYLNWRSVERAKERSEKEKEFVLKELNFIKAQFNSHFTFNFFNFCYNKTLYASSKAAKSIESFSAMLLFSLKNDSNECVILKEEVAYIENFVIVQKCITSKVFVELNYDEKVNDYYILPGIISTLVENAFKHGVFSDESNPILVSLSVQENMLTVIVKNKKASKKRINSTGIGLIDMIETLKLFYPKRHEFKVYQTDKEYCSKIILELVPVG